MSICTDCFRAADHAGHDFNMFRSQAGGACDCGDAEVMRPEGFSPSPSFDPSQGQVPKTCSFCKHHGEKRETKTTTPPPGLTSSLEVVLVKLLVRIVHHLRLKTRRSEVARDYLPLSS